MYTCIYCREAGDVVGVVQTELRYYSLNLNTDQWEDFHGDESVESQEFFCINCKKKIKTRI